MINNKLSEIFLEYEKEVNSIMERLLESLNKEFSEVKKRIIKLERSNNE